MPRRFRTIAVVILAGLVACHGKETPTSPSMGPHVPGSIRIQGPSSIPPGGSAQFRVIQLYSDSTTEDVTSRATWTSSNRSVLTISPAGLATGASRGASILSAQYGVGTPIAVQSVSVLEDGTFVLRGLVVEDTLPIPGVQVMVMHGTGEGLTAVTTESGNYTLYGVAGGIELRATKDGYRSIAQSAIVNSPATVDLTMQQTVGPTDFSGQWQLTITPSSSCPMLPDDVGPRNFTVNVSQFGAKATFTIAGDKVVRPANVIAHVTDKTIDFTLQAANDYYSRTYDLVESLAAQRYLAIDGVAHLDESAGSLRGTLIGHFSTLIGSFSESARVEDRCYAVDHRIVMRQ
jgi:carboxypeptidase family protein